MEARKITVVSTKNQTKKVIMSGAETLGQLKADLDNAGIDYQDMAFFEGTSRTELMSDDSVLPRDVPYTNRTTGETTNTNELVFMLTNADKKIKSGSVRKDLYEAVKQFNLKDKCFELFGKNYTQVSNTDLEYLIKVYSARSAEAVPVKETEKIKETPKFNKKSPEIEAIVTLVECLFKQDVISITDVDSVLDCLEDDSESPYSDDEIDAMFDGMCN